jgi:hypothetical protein
VVRSRAGYSNCTVKEATMAIKIAYKIVPFKQGESLTNLELALNQAAEGGWVLDRIEPEYQIAIFESIEQGDDDDEHDDDEDYED